MAFPGERDYPTRRSRSSRIAWPSRRQEEEITKLFGVQFIDPAHETTNKPIVKRKKNMALKIRLARGGSKKRPYYRIVIADIRMPRDGRFIEKVGSWNPMLPKDDENRVKLEVERIKYWISLARCPPTAYCASSMPQALLKRKARNNPQQSRMGQEPALSAKKRKKPQQKPLRKLQKPKLENRQKSRSQTGE